MSYKTFRGRYDRISGFYKDEEKSMWTALDEYEDLATHGLRYPDHRVNRLFADLKWRFLRTHNEFWEQWDNFGVVAELFEHAVTRADKVAAIDGMMNLEHENGQVLSALYIIESERKDGKDEDGEQLRRIDNHRDYVDSAIYRRLQDLANNGVKFRPRMTKLMAKSINRDNPRRNPLDDFRGIYPQYDYAGMMNAIDEYVKLAKAGLAYPTHRVNRLFKELKGRFIEGWNLNEWDGGDPSLTLLYKLMTTAQTRAEKVIAIDSLMHEQHYNGHVITAIYGFYDDDEDEHKSDIAREGETHIRGILNELSKRTHYMPLRLRNPTAINWDLKDTGMSFYNNFFTDPEYMRRNKGKVAELVWMTPHKYILWAALAHSRDYDLGKYPPKQKILREMQSTRPDGVQRIIGPMQSGAKFYIPVADLSEGGNQEGRHRALAAEQLGADKIPVLIVRDAKMSHLKNPIEVTTSKSSLFGDEEKSFVFRGNRYVRMGGWIDGNTMHINEIYITRGHRNHGLGRAALAELEVRAKDLGVKYIELDALYKARGFWEKLGYYYETDSHDAATMVKKL